MKKLYRKLTKEQKARNVIFSSCLSTDKTETGTIHEVFADDSDRWIKINRLLDDKFFKRSPFNYNIIRR